MSKRAADSPVDNHQLCDKLIDDMEQCTFTSDHGIMAVYSMKERLLRQKPLFMKQMTLEKVFHNGAKLNNSVPGPLSDVKLQPEGDGCHNIDGNIDLPSNSESSN